VTVSAFKKRPAKTTAPDLGAERTLPVRVRPQPLVAMSGFPGYVAVDLGNTGSMLAYMNEDGDDTTKISLLEIDKRFGKDAIPTAVRVTAYAPPPANAATSTEDAGPMPTADWVVGKDAMSSAEGALILGSKRLLSDPRRGESHQVWLNGNKQSIPKVLPAELFLARIVQRFHESQTPPRQIYGPRPVDDLHLPAPQTTFDEPQITNGLAVTYPTTFSQREIHNLRRAVYSGWRRALGETRYKYPDEEMQQAIALLIDEASAAAMFFVYRDLLLGPGKARALPYLYPNGVNLLVYDCGGGTTDIALIHVFAVYDAQHDRVGQLHIDVIGRTGHRAFGGDDVTAAVFSVLKLKAALKLMPGNANPKPIDMPNPPTPAAVAEAIHAKAAAIDALVLTRFNRAHLDRRNVRDQADAVLEMWREAENIKIALETKTQASPHFQLAGSAMAAHLAAQRQMRIESVPQLLNGLVVTRDEVNEVIRKPVAVTFDRANGLIRRRLGPLPKPTKEKPTPLADSSPAMARARKAGEVHRVYVLGNASRYPLVREGLEAELNVPFLKGVDDIPGRMVFEPENLKGAVAKGGVAALRLQHIVEGVVVRFDNNLVSRLPFDIWLDDMGRNDQRIYREGELYEELEEKSLPKPFRPEGDTSVETGRTVKLKRQWPDEPAPMPYLTFRFPVAVEGPLLIRFIPETQDEPAHFEMSDQGAGGSPVIGEERAEAQYISPPQSGEL